MSATASSQLDLLAAKMPRANAAVAEAMIPGLWMTLSHIADRTRPFYGGIRLSEGTVSTRISANKKYGVTYTKRKITGGYEYKRLT